MTKCPHKRCTRKSCTSRNLAAFAKTCGSFSLIHKTLHAGQVAITSGMPVVSYTFSPNAVFNFSACWTARLSNQTRALRSGFPSESTTIVVSPWLDTANPLTLAGSTFACVITSRIDLLAAVQYVLGSSSAWSTELEINVYSCRAIARQRPSGWNKPTFTEVVPTSRARR